jgi:hypothetical protein
MSPIGVGESMPRIPKGKDPYFVRNRVGTHTNRSVKNDGLGFDCGSA